MAATKPVYLIDASIYIFRSYFAMPDRWFSPEGYSVNAVYGYFQFLLKFLDQQQPKFIGAAFDESLGTCFRNEIYQDYKSSRVLPDEELAFQLEGCRVLTELMGISSHGSQIYEADDLIATMANLARINNRPVCIVSRDKDLGQLIRRKHDSLWDYAAEKRYSKTNFFEHYRVRPDQLIDYLRLVGDPIDDIPGVPGIGKKTASDLLAIFGSVYNMQMNLDKVADCPIRGAKSIASKIHSFEEQLEMTHVLITLIDDAPMGIGFDDLQWQKPSLSALEEFIEDYGLGNRLRSQLQRYQWIN